MFLYQMYHVIPFLAVKAKTSVFWHAENIDSIMAASHVRACSSLIPFKIMHIMEGRKRNHSSYISDNGLHISICLGKDF